jgi:RND family efflux transporter MFP subunit
MRKKAADLYGWLLERVGRRVLYGAGVLVVLLLGWLFFRGSGEPLQTLVVMPGEFLQQVSVSGKVVSAQDVDLAFPLTGRVTSLSVEVGERVRAGQTLATLEMGTLAADLRAAEADLALTQAQAGSAQENLDEVTREQNTLVENAYRNLLSEDLAAVPAQSFYGVDTPVITGIYEGEEGTYKVRLTHDPQLGSNKHQMYVFDLESTGAVEALESEPTPLGTRGLFISFPGDLDTYDGTIWYVTIPNTKSASYLQNYNAYQEALRTRTRAIAAAQAELLQSSQGLTVSEAQIASAQAQVDRIRAEIAERVLRAPFHGIITAVDIEVGGVVSSHDGVLSLISDKALQVESFVPEINLSLLSVGNSATVTLDAYGENVLFEAEVVSIDPAETVRDGVSTYRAILQFLNEDDKIRAGMTANVTITTLRKENVISVPQGVIERRDGKTFLKVKAGEEVVEREVLVGEVSSLGSIEIVSGLSAGEEVILSGA